MTRVRVLTRYSMPRVLGGLVFALAAVGFAGNGVSGALQDTAKSDLLLLFFASLGLSSDLRQLARSNPAARLLRLLEALATRRTDAFSMALLDGRVDLRVRPC